MRVERVSLSPAGASGLLLSALIALMVLELQGMTGRFDAVAWFAPIAGSVGSSDWLLALTWWPRLATALLAGAGLAVAGVLMQQVLRNPLASPSTLGVAGGANLALMAASLFAPGLMLVGSEWVALLGGAAAMGLVFLLSWHRGLSPLIVVLAGLVVNLYLGALAMALLLFNQETLQGLLIWGAGSLAQDGWHDAAFLLPRLAIGLLAAWLLLRPLRVLELDDASGRSLGVNLAGLRLVALGAAVFLTGTVVSVVGLIGFIGLAAPNIARLLGAERLGSRLIWATIIGALLLAVTDLALQSAGAWLPTLIPTGAMTAALGAPLLLWLIPRLRLESSSPVSGETAWPRAARPGRRLTWFALALVPFALLAIFSGHVAGEWQWWADRSSVWEWRLPRMLAAAGAGILLAVAGTLLQRLTGNPMASPEVLGISSGVTIFLLLGIVLLPAVSLPLLIGLGTAGAFMVSGFVTRPIRRLTGQVGVCLSTLGPGATNLVTAAAYAQAGKVMTKKRKNTTTFHNTGKPTK